MEEYGHISENMENYVKYGHKNSFFNVQFKLKMLLKLF